MKYHAEFHKAFIYFNQLGCICSSKIYSGFTACHWNTACVYSAEWGGRKNRSFTLVCHILFTSIGFALFGTIGLCLCISCSSHFMLRRFTPPYYLNLTTLLKCGYFSFLRETLAGFGGCVVYLWIGDILHHASIPEGEPQVCFYHGESDPHCFYH